jgi:hypothetical protein
MDEFKKLERDIISDKEKTKLKKEKFIKDIKSGLGEMIINNGNKVTKIKKSFIKRFFEKLSKMF